LSDVDVLLAALAHRLDGIIASSDSDYDPLPVKRENWRE
jgi:predicted nucleic acid-binding protein